MAVRKQTPREKEIADLRVAQKKDPERLKKRLSSQLANRVEPDTLRDLPERRKPSLTSRVASSVRKAVVPSANAQGSFRKVADRINQGTARIDSIDRAHAKKYNLVPKSKKK